MALALPMEYLYRQSSLAPEQVPVPSGATLGTQSDPGGANNVTITNFRRDADGTVNLINHPAVPVNVTSIFHWYDRISNAGAIPVNCPTATCAVFPWDLPVAGSSRPLADPFELALLLR